MPKVWKYKPKGEASCHFVKPEDVLAQVEADLKDGDGGWLDEAGKSVEITCVEMTEDEIKEMDEFAGW